MPAGAPARLGGWKSLHYVGAAHGRSGGEYVVLGQGGIPYYILFAVMGGSTRALVVEAVTMGAFAVVAIAGFRWSRWLVAIGLAAHGAFDLIHARLVANPGVPPWWPPFCLAFDFCIAAVLAWLLRAGVLRARPEAGELR